MLKAGRTLFTQNGYDNATTAAIARAAGCSESQLIKQFGSKEGLLVAIFEEGWTGISRRMDRALSQAFTPAEKIGLLAHTMLEALEHDSELKLLFLIEGRRVSGRGSKIAISNGFLDLVNRAGEVLTELQTAGELHPDLHSEAVGSGLVGMMEGLQRDHVKTQQAELPRMLSLVVQSLLGGDAAPAA
jgi:AcrR family transcriptional regulator